MLKVADTVVNGDLEVAVKQIWSILEHDLPGGGKPTKVHLTFRNQELFETFNPEVAAAGMDTLEDAAMRACQV